MNPVANIEDLLRLSDQTPATNVSEMNLLRAHLLETVLEAAYKSSANTAFLETDCVCDEPFSDEPVSVEASASENLYEQAAIVCRTSIEDAANHVAGSAGPCEVENFTCD